MQLTMHNKFDFGARKSLLSGQSLGHPGATIPKPYPSAADVALRFHLETTAVRPLQGTKPNPHEP